MLRLTPILLIIAYAAGMWLFSSWRTRRELAQNSTPLTHPRLTPLLEQLGAAMDLPPIRARVYEIPAVNGLAAPDGQVFLTRGFLRQMEQGAVTAEELASVIAHELGHVAHGHARRRMADFGAQNLLRMVLIGLIGRFLPGIGVWIANLIASAFAARLSQADEYEADAFASALMIRAGLGVQPQISLFRKLDALTSGGAMTRRPPAWLMSHPHSDKRIAAIEERAARWRAEIDAPSIAPSPRNHDREPPRS